MSKSQTYPVEYRGNEIYDETNIRNLNPEDKPNLTLVQGQYEVNQVLDSIGVEYDNESIVLEDSYGCLWVKTEGGEFTEVWRIHKSVPYLHLSAVRLR